MTFIKFDWTVVFMVETSSPDHLLIYFLDVSPPNLAVMLNFFVQVNCKVPDLFSKVLTEVLMVCLGCTQECDYHFWSVYADKDLQSVTTSA